MIFLGTAFAAYTDSYSGTLTPSESVTLVTAGGAIYDDLYVSAIVTGPDASETEREWDAFTILHCTFDGTLAAGNVDYYAENVDMVRIKRRKVGELQWVTIWQQDINSTEDLDFDIVDYAARSGYEYEYSCVPVVAGVEGSAQGFRVMSEFDGLFLAESDVAFGSLFDTKITSQRNSPVSVVNTINRRYPYVIRNSANNYESGSATAFFAEYNSDVDDVDAANGWVYRNKLKDFLFDGKPKIMKFRDGRMWLVSISSPQVTDEEAGHEWLVHTNFEWTEIGDCDNGDDLHNNNIYTNPNTGV